jgi:hypothetical protein
LQQRTLLPHRELLLPLRQLRPGLDCLLAATSRNHRLPIEDQVHLAVQITCEADARA